MLGISDSSEWKFLFKHGLDWDKILPLYFSKFPTEEGLKDKEEVMSFFSDLINQVEGWCKKSVEPRSKDMDAKGSSTIQDGAVVNSQLLNDLYSEAKELDIFNVFAPRQQGGMEVPCSVMSFNYALLCKACLPSGCQLGFFFTIMDMLDRFCDQEDQDRLIPQIMRGEISGSMCITEPGCGSDVGAIKTTATPQEDGTFLLNGTKIFITNGGGGIQFVLARIKGAPEGLAGISMFLTEEWITDPGNPAAKSKNYNVTKIEDKLGFHGSPTCEIVYEDSRAKLVGEANSGFKQMLFLMNYSRVEVGLSALMVSERAFEYALKYAKERKQFHKPIAELPLMRRQLADIQTEIDALRAWIVDGLSHFDIYQRLHLKEMKSNDLTQDEKALYRKAKKIVRRRTPLIKYYGTEATVTITRKCIQILGGYGFMKDYNVERYHRDSFGPLLYEGTSQIQSLMAFQDLMKVIVKNPRKYFQSVLVPATFSGPETRKEFYKIRDQFKLQFAKLLIRVLSPDVSLKDPISVIKKMVTKKHWAGPKKIERLMEEAEVICEAQAYIETLRVLNQHATKHPERKDLFFRYQKIISPRLSAIYTRWGA